LLDKLQTAGKVLGNSDIPGYNRAKNFLKEEMGASNIVAFNNLRDDTVAEVERGLLGTGVLSDSKYLRAVKNVNSAQSYSQLQAAVRQMRTVISARLGAIQEGSTPPPKTRSSSAAPKTAKDYLAGYGD
jgi:hypothetical protein